ncbi:MAG: S53 family peptidase [Oscillospiraceae bacterium]|nr:S53 family peptidase [Oscillospiraceae bacterium]
MNRCSSRRARPFVSAPVPLSQSFQGGYTPQQIQTAYQFPPSAGGRGQTIALVDAYGQPNIRADLEVFSRRFGLPPATLTIERMGLVPSAPEENWALETSLDVEWAHALAPQARLLLVLAASGRIEDLMQAAAYAASAGADVVSMSWGQDEFSGETQWERVFSAYPDTVFVAAAGDVAAVPVYPSVSPLVLSVGGTTLELNGAGRRVSETAWPGGGGGPSAYFSIPGFQRRMTGILALTGGARGTPDVSFSANPYAGVAVYHSFTYQGGFGWGVVGGSSFSAVAWAAVAAISRQTSGGFSPTRLYRLAGGGSYRVPQPYFYDITQGGNRLYQAGPGWDLCTGLGSPRMSALPFGLGLGR